MAATAQVGPGEAAPTTVWYALTPDEAAKRLEVDPAQGLSAATAAELLQKDGPNALPAEKAVPGWQRFLGQYRSYMQILLLGAGVLSLIIGEWSTAALLFVLTVLNAVVGLRQEGKAESAVTARVRRGGVESAIPGVGDPG